MGLVRGEWFNWEPDWEVARGSQEERALSSPVPSPAQPKRPRRRLTSSSVLACALPLGPPLVSPKAQQKVCLCPRTWETEDPAAPADSASEWEGQVRPDPVWEWLVPEAFPEEPVQVVVREP